MTTIVKTTWTLIHQFPRYVSPCLPRSGHTEAFARATRVCSDGSCPGIFPDNYHLEHLDRHPRPGSALIGVQERPKVRHGLNSVPLPPCRPSPTCSPGALSYPLRSLDRRRRSPSLDGQSPRGRCHGRCRRYQPLRDPQRRPNGGALVWCTRLHAACVHTPHRLLSITTSL